MASTAKVSSVAPTRPTSLRTALQELVTKWRAEAVKERQTADRKVTANLAASAGVWTTLDANADELEEVLVLTREPVNPCRCGHEKGDHQTRIGRGNYTPCCTAGCVCDGFRKAATR